MLGADVKNKDNKTRATARDFKPSYALKFESVMAPGREVPGVLAWGRRKRAVSPNYSGVSAEKDYYDG